MNFAKLTKDQRIALGLLLATFYWFLLHLPMPTTFPAGKDVPEFLIFIHGTIKEPLFLFIVFCFYRIDSLSNITKDDNVLGTVLGFVLGTVLGTVLGVVLSAVLGFVLGTVLGLVFGFVLGFVLGVVLAGEK